MEPRGTPVRLETKKLTPTETGKPDTLVEPTAPLSAPIPEAELTPDAVEKIEKCVLDAIKTCYDPEIPVNIFELGLIYNVNVSPTGGVHVRMTLTSPACPAAGSLPPEVEEKVKTVDGVTSAKVEVVWEPPWNQSMMSEVAAVELGLF